MISLRIMNAFFSAGAIFVLYKLTEKLDSNKKFLLLPALLTLTSSVYFVASFSTLAEIMFTFFLMLSIYLFYSKAYLFSTIIVSFLPTIRQEGVIFCIIWAYLLLKNKQIRYLTILFIPSFLWSLLNSLILGHDILYTFFYAQRLSPQTPPISLVLPSEIDSYFIWTSLPLVFLFLLGIKVKLSDKRYSLILLCVLSHLGFLIIASFIKWLKTGYLVRETKFIIPSIPFVAVYISEGLEVILGRFVKNKKDNIIIFILLMIVFVNFMIFRLSTLQRIPRVVEDSVTDSQLIMLNQASVWLNDYMQRNQIYNLFVLGNKATNKFARRIWMNVSGKVRYYAVINGRISLDILTFKKIPFIKDNAIFISVGSSDYQHRCIAPIKKEHLKEFAEIKLDFFLLNLDEQSQRR